MKNGLSALLVILIASVSVYSRAVATPELQPTPTPTSDVLTPLTDALTAPVIAVAAPLTNLDTALADAKAILGDLKTNTRFQIDKLETGMVYDTLNGRTLLGSQLPFLNLGSYDKLAIGLFAPVTGTLQSTPGTKGVPLLNNEIELNAITRPIVKALLNAVPALKSNLPLMTNLADAVKAGAAVGHDPNLTARSKILLNTAGVSLTFTLKFQAVSDLLKAQK